MSTRIPKSLLALAIGGFGIGLTEFVLMGLLPDVATDLGVTIPAAGYLISSYALGVVIGAPTLILLAGGRPPKQILLALMTVFTACNGLSGLMPGFGWLTAMRFLSGLPHGAYFGVGAVVAARIAGPERAAAAFAVMLGGLTVANVVGVPLATYVGHHLSWRAAFALVALVGACTVAAIAAWVPNVPRPAGTAGKHPLTIFGNPDLWSAVVITAVGFGGFFSWFSYIAPLLTNETGLSADWVPWVMSLAGVGMTVGNYAGGQLSDRLTPPRAITLLLFTMTVVLIADALVAPYAWAIVPLAFVTGANAMAMGAPLQMLLIQSSRESELLGSSVGQAAFNVGNSLGAFLAGLPLTAGYGYASADWVGAGMSGLGLLIAWRFARPPDRAGLS